jgi:hypothetical protein
MGPLALMGIGAGVGLLKSGLVDGPRVSREREYQANVARYSPWTGMRPSYVAGADTLGNAMQGGISGYMFGQALDNKASDDLLKNEQMKMMQDKNNSLLQQMLQNGTATQLPAANTMPSAYSTALAKPAYSPSSWSGIRIGNGGSNFSMS